MTLSRTLHIGGRDALLECSQKGTNAEITVTFDGNSSPSEARRLVLGAHNWASAAGFKANCRTSGDQLVIDTRGEMLNLMSAIDRIEGYLEQSWNAQAGNVASVG